MSHRLILVEDEPGTRARGILLCQPGAPLPPAPNVQGAGNVALGGCNLGLGGHNACTDSALAPPICGDGVVATAFGECEPPGTATCDANCKPIP